MFKGFGEFLISMIQAAFVPDFIRNYKPGSLMVYLLTILPGLENIAADECVCKDNVDICALMRGKVFVSKAGFFAYSKFRSVDNVYELLHSGLMDATRGALNSLFNYFKYESFGFVIDRVRTRYRANNTPVSFTVNASIVGRHNYSRFEISDAFADFLEHRYHFTRGTHDHRDIEFRLDIINGFYLLSHKLTDAAFRFRGGSRGVPALKLRDRGPRPPRVRLHHRFQ